jgi:hypothetical protein
VSRGKLRNDQSARRRAFPGERLHWREDEIATEAWTVGNLEVQIGPIKKSGNAKVDEFNELVMEIFNLASGNMLQSGNVLAWNVWFTTPELVNQAEWMNHAVKWRDSIDADHGSPDGPRTTAKYFDGSPFNPVEGLLEAQAAKIAAYILKHL